METIKNLFMQNEFLMVHRKEVIIAIVIIGLILVIVAIAKKLIKVAILLFVVFFIFGGTGIAVIDNAYEKMQGIVSVGMTSSTLMLQVSGQSIEIPKAGLVDVTLVEEASTGDAYFIFKYLKTGNKKIKIPSEVYTKYKPMFNVQLVGIKKSLGL